MELLTYILICIVLCLLAAWGMNLRRWRCRKSLRLAFQLLFKKNSQTKIIICISPSVCYVCGIYPLIRNGLFKLLYVYIDLFIYMYLYMYCDYLKGIMNYEWQYIQPILSFSNQISTTSFYGVAFLFSWKNNALLFHILYVT